MKKQKVYRSIRFTVDFNDLRYEGVVNEDGVHLSMIRANDKVSDDFVPVNTIPLVHWPALVEQIDAAIKRLMRPCSSGLSESK